LHIHSVMPDQGLQRQARRRAPSALRQQRRTIHQQDFDDKSVEEEACLLMVLLPVPVRQASAIRPRVSKPGHSKKCLHTRAEHEGTDGRHTLGFGGHTSSCASDIPQSHQGSAMPQLHRPALRAFDTRVHSNSMHIVPAGAQGHAGAAPARRVEFVVAVQANEVGAIEGDSIVSSAQLGDLSRGRLQHRCGV
jgi:hypothetical protein